MLIGVQIAWNKWVSIILHKEVIENHRRTNFPCSRQSLDVFTNNECIKFIFMGVHGSFNSYSYSVN